MEEYKEYKVSYKVKHGLTKYICFTVKKDVFGEYIKEEEVLGGIYSYRGVWDSRVYFSNDLELWGDELSSLAELYENEISPKCQSMLKELIPNIED